MKADYEEDNRYMRELSNTGARELANQMIECKLDFEDRFGDEINSNNNLDIQRSYDTIRSGMNEAIEYYEGVIKGADDD